MSLFYYKRVVKKTDKPEEVLWDCLNTNCIIRGLWYEGQFIILLNDGHEESEYVSEPTMKNGKMIKDGQKSRRWKFTDISLDVEDAARLRRIMEAEDYNSIPYESEMDWKEKEEDTLVQTND